MFRQQLLHELEQRLVCRDVINPVLMHGPTIPATLHTGHEV